ncbi:MAG: helix-turn-helix domain-containing protein [Solirubrobacteraceae bacterium]
MTSVQDSPWESLDPALAELLAPRLPNIAEEIIAAIGASIPEYQRPMGGAFGRAVRAAIEEALRTFLASIGRPGAVAQGSGREVYMALGRGEWRAGRGLEALQAAYRLGARVAWRQVARTARESGVGAEALALLAESIFAYIDEISGASVEGFAQAQAAAAGERQARRERLAALLLAAPAAARATREQAALLAGGPLPRELAALVGDERVDPRRLAARIGPEALDLRAEGLACVLVPDPRAPGLRESLAAALAGAGAVLGPARAPGLAGESFEQAAGVARLLAAGALGAAGGLLFATDWLAPLIVLGRAPLGAELARRRLDEPLAGLTPAARARLLDTLSAWLRLQGSVPAVADRLHVHRQTVRYRLAQLRDLYGPALDADPELRFELELALRARSAQALGPTTPH